MFVEHEHVYHSVECVSVNLVVDESDETTAGFHVQRAVITLEIGKVPVYPCLPNKAHHFHLVVYFVVLCLLEQRLASSCHNSVFVGS